MRIAIGRILKPHGIKGEIKILPETIDINRFEKLDKVYLERDDSFKEYQIDFIRITTDGKVFIKFEGVVDRNEAELLRGMIVSIDESESLPLPDNIYYHYQIEGMVVYDRVSKRELGEIDKIVEAGSSDLYIVKSGEKEYMIPALKKFVKKIDVENKRMEIESIPGLLDL